MISVFILPSNHFRNWDAQREKEREKERLIDAQREKDRAVDHDCVKRQSRSREASITIARNIDCDRVIHRADHSPSSNPVTSLCSFFSQFDRIWWFFSGFCLCFCIEEWMILYICLAIEKMWENMTGFDRIWWFFFWVLFMFLYWGMNDIIYSFGNWENVSNK